MNDHGTEIDGYPVELYLIMQGKHVTGWTEDRDFAYSCCSDYEHVIKVAQV